MIATGNHNFERFAALCNTPEVEPRALRARAAYQCVNNIPAKGVSTTMTTEKVKESTDVNVARC